MFLIIEPILLLFLLYSLLKTLLRKLSKPNYQGKTIWITGASSGIGEYLAYQFCRYGANLVLSARNLGELERVRQECVRIGGDRRVEIVRLDMTDFRAVKEETEKVVKRLEQRGEKLDMIVENAGISMRAQFKNYNFQNHQSMFDLNVHGPFLHIQSCLPHMISNKSGQIVAITSAQGKLSPTFRTSYAGSKHAVIGILDSLRSELHEYNIKVTNIMPGYVRTNLSRNAFSANAGQKCQQDQKKGMEAEDFCREAVKAIYRGENQAQISNQLSVPIGIFLRNLCPDLVFFGLRQKSNKKPQTPKQKSA